MNHLPRYRGVKVPGKSIRRLGIVQSDRIVKDRDQVQDAERIAIGQLDSRAQRNGANAIIGFSVAKRPIRGQIECFATGIAAKLTPKENKK
jgi:uncharacterized protein YbjQ (UPF0145 family)